MYFRGVEVKTPAVHNLGVLCLYTIEHAVSPLAVFVTFGILTLHDSLLPAVFAIFEISAKQ